MQLCWVVCGLAGLQLLGCQHPAAEQALVLPTHPISQGVSAPFAGFIGEQLIVGGGCNFPSTPAADGGKKVFYPSVFSLETRSDSLHWINKRPFPHPLAYGASVELPNSLICLGGMNEQSSLSSVWAITLDSLSRQISLKELPPLPETFDNAAATSIGERIFITGGNQGNQGKALYALHCETDTAWTRLADYPGPKRIQPVLLASDHALFLFGGFEVNPDTNEACISSNFLVYALDKGSWSVPQPIPPMNDGSKRALVGAAGTRVGNQFILAGGVNYAIFKQAVEGKAPDDYLKRPTEWYQFSKEVLSYDFHANEWNLVPNVEGFNKAGGCLLQHNGTVYMVCGEIKPGIRTNAIVQKKLSDLLPTKYVDGNQK